MISFLAIGVILGLSAGFAPGPLLTLVISETLRHDVKSGVKVALAPVITDLPIIILTLFLLAKLADFHNILGIISICGGIFVGFMGYNSLRVKGVRLNLEEQKPRSLSKGILVNTLSPHPYLFWLSVGSPMVTRAMEQGLVAALAFVGSFYLLLVGSKIGLAVLVGRSKSFLTGKMYINIMRFLGLVLCGLAVGLLNEGIKFLTF